MLNGDVIRVKSTLRALVEAQFDIKENQRNLGQFIQYYEMSIPNIRQKKAAFAATLATFDNIRIDMEEQKPPPKAHDPALGVCEKTDDQQQQKQKKRFDVGSMAAKY